MILFFSPHLEMCLLSNRIRELEERKSDVEKSTQTTEPETKEDSEEEKVLFTLEQ